MLMTSFATFCPKLSEDEQQRINILMAFEEMYHALPGNSQVSFSPWRVNEPLTSQVTAQRLCKALNVDGHEAACRFFPEKDLLLVMVKPPSATSVANPPHTDNMLACSSVRWNFIDFCKMEKQISRAPRDPNAKNKCFLMSDQDLASMSTTHEEFPYLGALLQRSTTGLPSCQSNTLRFFVDGMVMILQGSKPRGWDGNAYAEESRVSFACEFTDGTRVSYSDGQPLCCTKNNMVLQHQWKSIKVAVAEGEGEGEGEDEVEVEQKFVQGLWIQQLEGPASCVTSEDSVAASYVTPEGSVVQWMASGNMRVLQADGTSAQIEDVKRKLLLNVLI